MNDTLVHIVSPRKCDDPSPGEGNFRHTINTFLSLHGERRVGGGTARENTGELFFAVASQRARWSLTELYCGQPIQLRKQT